MRRPRPWYLAAAAAVAAALPQLALAAGDTTELVSQATGGQRSNGFSGYPALSADGRLVAFASRSDRLAAGDRNARNDVFVRDRAAGTTTRVSVGPAGAEGDGSSVFPLLSRDGRYVAFYSEASTLVPKDLNKRADAFVRDLALGATVRASLASTGREALTGGGALPTAISADGRLVAFISTARDLVPGTPGPFLNLFVRDMATGVTTLEALATGGAPANKATYYPAGMSGDGRFIAFASDATNLTSLPLNRITQVYLRDRAAGTTSLVSVDTKGGAANNVSGDPVVSDDGTVVAFSSLATDLVAGDTNGRSDAFVRDMVAGTTTRIGPPAGVRGQANGITYVRGISADGRYVLLASEATNLVAGDTNGWPDLFVFDRQTATTTRASLGATGKQGAGGIDMFHAAISADGSVAAFSSTAPDLVTGDKNKVDDVFVRVRAAAEPPPPPPPPPVP